MSHPALATRRFSGLLAAVYLLGVAGPLAAALNSQEQELANRVINDPGQARASVTIDPILSAVARAKAADMANREYFAHVDPDGHGANYLVRKAGYALPSSYSTDPAANNIESLAAGYASVAEVWTGWMNSPSHKTHILGLSSFFAGQTSLGVGFHQDADAPYRYDWVIITAPPNGPRLTISAPAANAALTVAQVNVTGTTGGDPAADRIQVRIESAAGNGEFVTATGRTSWSAALSGLAAGNNTIRVRSLDASGGVILELTRTVRVVVLAPLTVAIEGSGTVTRGFAGTSQREVGANFTVTATPGSGWLFAEWTGGASATKAALTMAMSEGLTLTARFVPNPFVARKGAYNGLFESDPFAHATSGLVQATVATTGAVTGKVTLGGATYSFSGKFDLSGAATITIARSKLAPLTVALNLDVSGDSERITGSVSDGAFNGFFNADRAWQTGGAPHANAGRYTVTLPAAEGAGWATLTVSTSGAATLAGALADGTAVSASGSVSKDGVLPIFKALYSAKGSLASNITFRATNSTDLDGLYHWSKPALATARSYQGAFSTVNSIAGSRYTAPASGQRVLAAADGADNCTIAVSGGNLDPAVTQPATLAATNRVTIAAPLLKGFAATVTTSNGRFSGSFTDPAAKAVRRFYGVLLQKQNRGFGYFLGTDASGLVEFAPADGGGTN